MKKIIMMAASLVLVAALAVGGTLAYLTDMDSQVNTFTVGNIDITLTESDGTLKQNNEREFKMIPGIAIDKDPLITVTANSEPCWLFVKVEKSASVDSYLKFALEDSWSPLPGVVDVYFQPVASATSDQEFIVLGNGSYAFTNSTTETEDDITISWGNNQVGVKPEVTKAMMDDIVNGKVVTPTLTFTAYAIQKAGFESALTDAENAAAAWSALIAQIS